MEKKLYSLPVKHIVEPARESLKYINGRRLGLITSLQTPWEKYNKVSMKGIEWQSIHTIAGMSGSGKTAILNMLETNLITLNPQEEFNILSFNFEMLAKNLITRKLSTEMELTVQELYSASDTIITDELYEKARLIGKELATKNIYYVDIPGTVQQIITTIENFIKGQPNKGLVVLLDHTILVKGERGEMERVVLVDLMTAFNELKKKYKICFVILSQLNRDIERADRFTEPSLHYPKKSDIFGGDSVYQFSDVVMVTVNPEQMGYRAYGPKSLPVKGLLYWHYLKRLFLLNHIIFMYICYYA
jgi:replicative DNA helicase